MNYTELELNGEMYKLRLNTRGAIALEKILGKNPLDILLKLEDGELPKLTDIVLIFHQTLQAYNHGINIEKAYDLFDSYVESGKTMFDFIQEAMIPVFQNAGFIDKSADLSGDSEKN